VSVRLVFQVQPRARKTGIAGQHGDAIRLRLAAPPVDGAANDELVRFLAERLGVTKRSVEITSGLTSRRKHVLVQGISEETAKARLA